VSGSIEGTGAFVIGRSLTVDKKNSSQGASNKIPSPSLPLRPVLPSRCIYCSLLAGNPTYICNKCNYYPWEQKKFASSKEKIEYGRSRRSLKLHESKNGKRTPFLCKNWGSN